MFNFLDLILFGFTTCKYLISDNLEQMLVSLYYLQYLYTAHYWNYHHTHITLKIMVLNECSNLQNTFGLMACFSFFGRHVCVTITRLSNYTKPLSFGSSKNRSFLSLRLFCVSWKKTSAENRTLKCNCHSLYFYFFYFGKVIYSYRSLHIKMLTPQGD